MHRKTSFMRTAKRIALMSVLCFILTNIASSATNRSGGGEKKQKQSSTLSLNYKKSPLTLQNGFRFRGGLHFNHSRIQTEFVFKKETTCTFYLTNPSLSIPSLKLPKRN
jgi:hypothetical protein